MAVVEDNLPVEDDRGVRHRFRVNGAFDREAEECLCHPEVRNPSYQTVDQEEGAHRPNLAATHHLAGWNTAAGWDNRSKVREECC